MEDISHIDRAIAVVGTLKELSDSLGEESQTVNNWRLRGNVPTEKCAKLEAITGGVVSRRDLRPKSWWIIWPELVTPEYPVPEAQP